jgi:hypothetical protein
LPINRAWPIMSILYDKRTEFAFLASVCDVQITLKRVPNGFEVEAATLFRCFSNILLEHKIRLANSS